MRQLEMPPWETHFFTLKQCVLLMTQKAGKRPFDVNIVLSDFMGKFKIHKIGSATN